MGVPVRECERGKKRSITSILQREIKMWSGKYLHIHLCKRGEIVL